MVANGHHRRLHDGDHGFFAFEMRVHFGGADGERAAGANDFSNCAKVVAGGGFHEIDFELDAENASVGGHQGERSVAASAVGDGCHYSSVQESMLLREAEAIRPFDRNLPGFDRG